MRLEGYYEAVRHGQFFPKVLPQMANHYGYAADLFYPSLLLLPYVFLRFLGFSYIHSYYGYMFLISLATYGVSYYSIQRIFQQRRIAFFFAVLYTSATYRLLDQFVRGALGETLAFIFLPLVLLGVYLIAIKQDGHWKPLALAMTLILYSHMITALITVISIGGFLLYLVVKRRCTWKVLRDLVKAAGTTFLLTCFILLPMIEQTRYLHFNFAENKQLWGIGLTYSPADLVINSLSNNSDNWSDLAPGVGILLILFLGYCMMRFPQFSPRAKALATLGVLYSILSTNLFPWVVFKSSVLSFIQFNWRILSFSTLFLSLALSVVVVEQVRYKGRTMLLLSLAFLSGFSFVTSSLYHFQQKNVGEITNQTYADYWTTSIGGGKEYLPVAANYEEIQNNTTDFSLNGQVSLEQRKERFNSFDYVASSSKNNLQILLPKIAYVGYSVKVDGEEVAVTEKQGLLSVKLPQGTHQLTVTYVGTNLQWVTLMISLLAWGGLLLSVVVNVPRVAQRLKRKRTLE